MLVRNSKTLARTARTFSKGYQKANSLHNKHFGF